MSCAQTLTRFGLGCTVKIQQKEEEQIIANKDQDVLGRTTSWSPKSQCVYGPENEIAAVTFFAKNGVALLKSNTFASVTEWQDSGEHGC